MDKKENFKLVFLAANFFLENDDLDRFSDRFNTLYDSSGLPGSLKSVAYPVPVFVNKVQDADCTEESVEKVIECYKENSYCNNQFFSIAQTLRNMNNIDTDTTFIAVFVCKQANLKDSHGDCIFDEENNNRIITIAFQRLDAIISTIFHELYELMLEDNDKDLHCNNSSCFMNPDSVALTLCDKCKRSVQLT